MDTLKSIVNFKLSPENSGRLVNLCGEYNRHIQQIEEFFNVSINYRGHEFHINGEIEQANLARDFIIMLYNETQTDTHLTSAKIHRHLKMRLSQQPSSTSNPQSTNPYIDTNEKIEKSENIAIKTKRGWIKSCSENQECYLRNIAKHDINFAIGPAGTGKTYLAVANAVAALEKEYIQRIVLVRPAVEAGEKLGFLPGDMAEKVNPYLRPLFDALYEMMGVDRVNKLIEQDVIEIAPLAYMRGRTLNDAFIIMDEAQNTTREQMKMFLTRIGFGSKAIITGDITQIDLPKHIDSGLHHAIKVLKNVPGISFTYFQARDAVRHPLVQLIIEAYDEQSSSSSSS